MIENRRNLRIGRSFYLPIPLHMVSVFYESVNRLPAVVFEDGEDLKLRPPIHLGDFQKSAEALLPNGEQERCLLLSSPRYQSAPQEQTPLGFSFT